MTGIEPALKAWKALVLPLHHIRLLLRAGYVFYFIRCVPSLQLHLRTR